MAYFAPYVDGTGYHIPTYQDIVDDLIDRAHEIFGADIYLGIDSQDYEWISITAKYIYDSFLVSQMAYTNRSPSTVIGGEPQDILYKINGIRRKQATYSTVVLTLTGTPYTRVFNGVAQDVAGNLWNLPREAIIGNDGTTRVTATAQESGRIIVLPGDINIIYTPTFGWNTVTNAAATIPGIDQETDQEFRERQVISVANPSRTVFEGTVGAIAAIEGVGRYRGYENDTGSPDANGIPAHSISIVVEGGDSYTIANTIYLHKTPGCGTYGDQSIIINDEFGNANDIKFYYVSYKQTFVTVNIRTQPNFNEDTIEEIKQIVVDYINNLDIGAPVLPTMITSEIITNAITNTKNATFSIVSVLAGDTEADQSTDDVTVPFNYVASGAIADVVVNIV